MHLPTHLLYLITLLTLATPILALPQPQQDGQPVNKDSNQDYPGTADHGQGIESSGCGGNARYGIDRSTNRPKRCVGLVVDGFCVSP